MSLVKTANRDALPQSISCIIIILVSIGSRACLLVAFSAATMVSTGQVSRKDMEGDERFLLFRTTVPSIHPICEVSRLSTIRLIANA